MNAKLYHYADKTDGHGGVSALCFKTPRRIDLKRASWTIRPDAVTCPKCRTKLTEKAPTCAVRGLIRPGAMCGAVIVGGNLCGFKGKCEHQRTDGVPAHPAPLPQGYRAVSLKKLAKLAQWVNGDWHMENAPVALGRIQKLFAELQADTGNAGVRVTPTKENNHE